MGQTVVALWASRERWLIHSLKSTFRFTLWNLCDRTVEFGHMNTTQHRYRLGVFPVPHGSVDSKVFPSSDPLMRANSVLVRFYVAEEGNDACFDVRGQDVHLTSQSLLGHEEMGELLTASASLGHRTELVLETTVDYARRVRQIPDVNHISQRKVGQNGRVRITVECLNLSSLKPRRTVAFGLVPRSVLLLGCSFINPWSNGKSCLLCSPRKRGILVVFCANHRDGSLSTLLQVCIPMK